MDSWSTAKINPNDETIKFRANMNQEQNLGDGKNAHLIERILQTKNGFLR
jgi:hypothetical protein